MRVVPRRNKRRTSTPAEDVEDRSPADRPPASSSPDAEDSRGPDPKDAKEPDAKERGAKERGAERAGVKGPGSKEPAGKGPDSQGSDSGAPGKKPGGKEPDSTAPAPKAPVGKKPGGREPDAKGPGSKEPRGDRPGSKGPRGSGEGAPSGARSGDTATLPLDRDTATLPLGHDTVTLPLDRDAAERARRAAALRRTQEQRRARAGRTRRARRRPRPALLALVITLGVLIAAVAVTGTLIATSRGQEPMPLAAPLHVYPVTQVVSGACPAGTQGITGQTVSGPACYQLSSGIAIRRVTELRVQRGQAAGTHDVAIGLSGADRQAFASLTRQTVGRTVAFVVRDQLVTAPRVDMPITDGKVVVTGRFSKTDADRLVRTLKGS